MDLVTLPDFPAFPGRLLNYKASLLNYKDKPPSINWRIQYCDIDLSQDNPKTGPQIYCPLTFKKISCFWGIDNVLFLNLDAVYMEELRL